MRVYMGRIKMSCLILMGLVYFSVNQCAEKITNFNGCSYTLKDSFSSNENTSSCSLDNQHLNNFNVNSKLNINTRNNADGKKKCVECIISNYETIQNYNLLIFGLFLKFKRGE